MIPLFVILCPPYLITVKSDIVLCCPCFANSQAKHSGMEQLEYFMYGVLYGVPVLLNFQVNLNTNGLSFN